jgi:predicted Kef-type K+ transport protein
VESTWPTISLGDPTWIVVAFLAGLAARQIRLPPLAGFLAAGFLLHALGARPGALLEGIADVGVTLLLFTVGLKVDLRLAARPQVWGVGLAHFVLSGALLTGVMALFVWARLGPFAALDLGTAALLATALTFSSTVFAVKVLADRGAEGSQHGRLAIGVLVLQDIVAVVLLVAVSSDVPQPSALLLLLLIPLAWPLGGLLDRAGHGELLVLFGVGVALGAAALFEATDVKGALGALVMGMLLGRHPKAEELSKSLLSVKDLFLLGFFLLIGMTSLPTPGG